MATVKDDVLEEMADLIHSAHRQWCLGQAPCPESEEIARALVREGYVRQPMGPDCGAVNPRTGWVCDRRVHAGDEKHWTIDQYGELYDWFVEYDG